MNLSDNLLLNYLVSFWSGVLVSFSPCVYPIMPITASMIGGLNTNGTRMRGLLISLVYVLGIAITYSSLAVFAALSGKLFGQLQNHPLTYLVVGNLLMLFSLVMFDVIPLPLLGVKVHGKVKVRNLWTVLFLGVTSGLIVGPCTAPVLGTLLIYVGSKQNVLYGASLLFVFSYGVGASLILIGTFSSALSSLPKSGPWLVRIKQICGMILLIAAEYFLMKAGRLWE